MMCTTPEVLISSFVSSILVLRKRNIRPSPIIASITCKGLTFTPKSARPPNSPHVESFQMQHDARLVWK